MRLLQRDLAISGCRIKCAFAILAFIYPLTMHSAAWADGFQQIRTFDPNKGFVAGNGSQTSAGSQSFSPPAGWSTQQSTGQNRSGQTGATASAGPTTYNSSMTTRDYSQSTATSDRNNAGADEQTDDSSRDSKHHKHHHKFLIFGHHEDDAQANETTDTSGNAVTRSPIVRSSTIQQNNKLYIPPSPTYNQEPVETVSLPVIVPHTSSPVIPPEPRQKPSIPVVDPNARLPLVQSSGAKSALAWRARAWRLANEADDTATALKHPSKILNCSPDEALTAAANCCRAKGAQIIGQSLPAGQLGVRFTDSANNRSLMIFVARSVGNNRTLLKASAESDKVQKIALSNDLIQQAAAIIDGKGLL